MSIPFTAALVLGLIVLLDGVFSPWLIRMECRREPLAGQLAEIRRLVVTTESLTLATASETLTLSWCKVDEVVEAPEHVFIRFGGNFAVVVPNACFKDASAKNDFLETVYRSYNDQP